VKRLSTFAEAMEPAPAAEPGIRSREAERFALNHLTLLTPNRARTLVRDLTLELDRGQNLVIVGQSGVGKSSILRAIAGLWTQGGGSIDRPPLSQIFFLPQKPYMLLGTLRDQLLYPRLGGEVPEEELRRALAAMGLEELPGRVGGLDAELDWADVLSLGEQQRLAFARLLIHRPRFAVLDEATSALDAAHEANLYRRLKQAGVGFISVGHRRSILEYHDRVLELQGAERWRWLTVEAYRAE
jgi:putative ATP-binding cassette transporter